MNASLLFFAAFVVPVSNSQAFAVCYYFVQFLLQREQCFALATYISWALSAIHCAAAIVFERIVPAWESFGLPFRAICFSSYPIASLHIISSQYNSAIGTSSCLE
jgi:hypothetical protein